MDFTDIISKVISGGVVGAIVIPVYKFYINHILEIELHVSPKETYCFVQDSERNDSAEKSQYFTQLKATINIHAGKSLGLADVRFVLREHKMFCQANYEAIGAPQNVQEFFKCKFYNGWATKDTLNKSEPLSELDKKKRWTTRSVVHSPRSFSNRPGGGYQVFMIVVLQRFTVTIPCRFASMGDGGSSTICSAVSVRRRIGMLADSVELSKGYDDSRKMDEQVYKLKLAILNFDFIPYVSAFKVYIINKAKNVLVS